MLETCEKQEANFWQGGRAVLESFHRSALIAEDVAAPVPYMTAGQAGYTRDFFCYSPPPKF